MTWTDLVLVVLGCLIYVFMVLPVFLKLKGEL
jgi:hypothetical protein